MRSTRQAAMAAAQDGNSTRKQVKYKHAYPKQSPENTLSLVGWCWTSENVGQFSHSKCIPTHNMRGQQLVDKFR